MANKNFLTSDRYKKLPIILIAYFYVSMFIESEKAKNKIYEKKQIDAKGVCLCVYALIK